MVLRKPGAVPWLIIRSVSSLFFANVAYTNCRHFLQHNSDKSLHGVFRLHRKELVLKLFTRGRSPTITYYYTHTLMESSCTIVVNHMRVESDCSISTRSEGNVLLQAPVTARTPSMYLKKTLNGYYFEPPEYLPNGKMINTLWEHML